jgi:hypothetical protein
MLGGLLFCPDLYAEHVYPFQGHLNLAEKKFGFSVKVDGAALKLDLEHKHDNAYKAVLSINDLRTPFFEMTTEIQSVVDVHKQKDRISSVSGLFWSQYSLIDHKTFPEMSGRFDFKDGILRVDDVVAGDFTAEGSVAIAPPHNLDAALNFDGIDIAYFLDWLSGERKFTGTGLMSGQIALTGQPSRFSLKASIESGGGYIENLAYDRMVLHLQGIYPVVELTNSTITKTNGFSFDLDGTVDLSDKTNMASQIASIKTVPLVKGSNLQSEWVLKRVQASDGSTTKYFMKRDKGLGLSGEDDYGVFGVERKIGF